MNIMQKALGINVRYKNSHNGNLPQKYELILLIRMTFCFKKTWQPFLLGYVHTPAHKTYLIRSHCLVADLPVNGTFYDAWHQLGNVFVIFLITWYLLYCREQNPHYEHQFMWQKSNLTRSQVLDYHIREGINTYPLVSFCRRDSWPF